MKPKLLLLEDEPTSRMFLSAATAAVPADVDLAQTLAQGLALARAGTHALWLFDANLPDGTGSELLAMLRAQGLDTPAIAHTAAPDAQERQRLLDDGFAAVLVKPLPAAAWQEAIRSALASGAGRASGTDASPVAADAIAPVWDDAAAAAALGGNDAHVVALRQLFLAELPGARKQVVSAAHDGDQAAMRAALHKLRASCGFVGAARLDVASRALRESPSSSACLQDFIDAAEATLS